MSSGPSTSWGTTIPDEFPARPTSLLQDELMRMSSMNQRKETKTLILLCLVYFLYGASMGLYGPLYPEQAKAHGVTTCIYGPVLSANLFVAFAFYPVACHMVNGMSSKPAICASLFMIGACKILFGSTAMINDNLFFILLSYCIQAVEGTGLSILLASTCFIVFSYVSANNIQNRGYITAVFVFGISVSPICGEAINKISNVGLDFSVSFYTTGILICLCSFLFAAIFPEPDQRLVIEDIPYLYWMKKLSMVIFFLVVFTTFNYLGFLTVTLEAYLQQFQLDKMLVGVLFAAPAISCGISAPGWKWVSGKGFNSVILTCFACLLILASLVFLVPPPFLASRLTIGLVSTALLMCGFASGGKLGCAVYTANYDLGLKENLDDTQDKILVSTVFTCGALLGCFSGSIFGGYLTMREASYVLLGLEFFTLIVSFVFAFTRNYRSSRVTTSRERDTEYEF